ncbi:Pyruvate/Phosphoenolpyruvate kinase-like domain-containing protein [Desarmillaria tabescens]|uniref:Pyruvate/Phosphoenolpyruvate kinase-like domain-containing protein n=1 Tax=Armillaria tabescens TaxID=1929756 RepID=A0AA39NLN5_ARMTA|nr:Pyruvate/Phosphoenolpyruvate kinase-like domain-containing protein [Desarmillaria tabescens]KAK0467870.1 Pyruvate/Phosphoenolpyruvate kinase-like domain-containing protein [Desarmillaria tabescens]
MSYSSIPAPAVATAKDERLGLHKVMADAANSYPRKPVVGSWLMLPGASLARMTAQMGYDFILVDCEHGDIADAAMHASVGAIAAQGVSPIVRIPAPENWLVKRTLDTGAHGILCPMMSTVDDARALVSYAKFPALKDKRTAEMVSGVRGAGSPFAPAAFGMGMSEYIATANRNTFIAVQIETVEGLSNCEEIAKVDGIDMLFVGPNDLASSMGYPPLEHPNIPEVQEAIKRVLAAAKAAGKYAGMFCTAAEQVQARFEQGFDFMNLGADVIALGVWNAVELGKLKNIRP